MGTPDRDVDGVRDVIPAPRRPTACPQPAPGAIVWALRRARSREPTRTSAKVAAPLRARSARPRRATTSRPGYPGPCLARGRAGPRARRSRRARAHRRARARTCTSIAPRAAGGHDETGNPSDTSAASSASRVLGLGHAGRAGQRACTPWVRPPVRRSPATSRLVDQEREAERARGAFRPRSRHAAETRRGTGVTSARLASTRSSSRHLRLDPNSDRGNCGLVGRRVEQRAQVVAVGVVVRRARPRGLRFSVREGPVRIEPSPTGCSCGSRSAGSLSSRAAASQRRRARRAPRAFRHRRRRSRSPGCLGRDRYSLTRDPPALLTRSGTPRHHPGRVVRRG